jgi:DNA polymerase-3 subunit gamma/tau
MSYLVLARKYRPRTFAEIVGQEHVTRTLANAFAQERVHHAFLFCGPRGVGKTSAARVLGKALNCERGPTADPCGECSPCQTIISGAAVDYYEMDGASNRGIDAIRELTDAVRYQPAVLRKKVYVIDEVHMLTTEAFNALLKTLEEPPPHVTFVMATTEPHKVPNTILSRCQRFDFKLVPRPRLIDHLTGILAREEIAIEPGAISLIARESGGSVRDALSLADQLISFVGNEIIAESRVAEVLGVADRSLTRALVGALGGGRAAEALELADGAIRRGVDEVQVARATVRHLRDLAVLQVTGDAGGQLVEGSGDERAALAEEARSIEARRLRQMFDRMMKACEDLGESQQPRLVLDFALIDVAAQEPPEPLGGLIERLGDLERRLAGRGGSTSGGGRDATRRPRATAEPERAPPVALAPPLPREEPAPIAAGSIAEDLPPIPPPEVAPPPLPKAPPPAAMPATVDGDPPPGDMLAAWERVIVALERERELNLVRVYEQAKVLEWTEERIEVGFAEDSLDAEAAAAGDKVEAMRSFLARHQGRPIGFSVKLLSGPEKDQARSLIEASRERREGEERRREGEARQHPMTKVVLETFGAQIQEIKTDV